LKLLIETGDIEIHFGFGHPNPHVRAMSLGDKDIQLKTLAYVKAEQSYYAVLYPTVKYLNAVVDVNNYKNQPYSLMLALGMPQLEILYFDPQVLKTYRDDPRYTYSYHGVAGQVCITTEGDEDEDVPESDKILIDTFGTGFSKDYETDSKTCVTAFPFYLHKLSSEHQMLWKHRQLNSSKYVPDHGFVQSQLYGSFDFNATVYEAFFAELRIINEMTTAVEGLPLFKRDYADGSKIPRNFHRLLLPTKREYQEFVEVLDKLISDNINREFFKRRLPLSFEDEDKGTIALFAEYLELFKTKDRSPIEQTLKTIRKVRSERSKSSHHDLEDEFNYKYNKKQRDIMLDAYVAIRFVRLVFTNVPEAKTVKVPEWLFRGEISPD